ncbi:hypothetical protein H6P81_003017 [Aristolochia fimbriata]|uniref:RanBP2-type domain-containing protein n=1 Tax=Aristolochia fimbriata TaxID=158543 RepID=A0AAV7FD31_ARIFI|nr:hypothetical protein H6P81_003017 [Aristolochia fimbriata]
MGGVSRFLMLLNTPLPLLCCRPSAFRLVRRSGLVSLASFPTPQSRRCSSSSRHRVGFSVKASEQIHTQIGVAEDFVGTNAFSSISEVPLPWPEWTHFIENLRNRGYFDAGGGCNVEGDAFMVVESLPQEFVRAANACLAFARNQPGLLRSLSKHDIEVILENGSAFLFKNASDSMRRLRTFLGSNDTEEAGTVDLMHFLLSHAYNRLVASHQKNYRNKELVEASARNLLNELIGFSGTSGQLGFTEPASRQFSVGHGQPPRPFGQNIEMKRGDWICTRCSFMNFARNMRCRQCNEDRPKRVLTGGEWECPQCDFFNYGRNAVCIRCDCKCPGEPVQASPSSISGLGFGQEQKMGQQFNGDKSAQSDIERRLAENDEKAARWFSKVSQVDNVSDLSNVADEDFPEIMPLRKGVNKFVVSTRKTPLERRLANAQYLRNMGNDGSPEGSENVDGFKSKQTSESSISESLDRILGRSSSVSDVDKEVPGRSNNLTVAGVSSPITDRLTSLRNSSNPGNPGRNSGYVPFVPLPPDMFAKPQQPPADDKNNAGISAAPAASVEPSSSGDDFSSGGAASETESKKIDDQAEKSERWFKKVQELHDVTDLASAISDEDFPEIMPMRKGENRFVVPKKKDRSLTSPQYKRRLAMEQANNSNFVPFVPFPPGYFAKKDQQSEDGGSVSTPEIPATPPVSSTLDRVSTPSENSRDEGSGNVSKGTLAPYDNTRDSNGGSHDLASAGGYAHQNFESKQNNGNSRNLAWSGESSIDTGSGPGSSSLGRYAQNNESQLNSGNGWNMAQMGERSTETGIGSGYRTPVGYSKEHFSSVRGTGSSPQQAESSQTRKEGWNQGFRGKSLEGSAVKEVDPLDMSEEAKTQRWFRRVAQIKDISELSQIPDEDFPSIMPMRKGVNRFVVSKRKTPLERRLTSQQYRRNLPIVSTDPSSTPPSDKNSS